ncbi:MAG: PAS domain S-box protein [Polyangiaceae bacterium]
MGPILRALLCVESDVRAAWFARALAHARARVVIEFVDEVAACLGRLHDGAFDLLICDVEQGRASVLDALPRREPRSAVPLIIVAESLTEAAMASYRLQALLCPHDSESHLLQAVEAVRSTLASQKGQARSFERGQREIIQHIAKGSPLPETLERIVRLVEAQAEGMLCSVVLLDAERRLLPMAGPSLPGEFLRAIAGLPIGPNEGSCGAAMARREPVFVRDIATHEYWVKYRDLALTCGLRASWSTPILSGEGDVLGAFAMYFREPRDPSQREYSWIEQASYLAAIAVLRDRTEQALRATESRYRQIVDTAYEGVWSFDTQGKTSFVNARAAELLGASVDEASSKSLFDFMGPQSPDAREQLLQRLRSVSEQHELRLTRQDGSELWVLVASSPLNDAAGQAVGVLGMLTDITALKRAEATLRQNELELRTIVDYAAIGIALVDGEGRPRRSNPALQRMLGYSDAELQRMSFTEFTHPDDVDADVAFYARLLKGEIKSYQFEKRYIRRDSSVMWGRLTVSLVHEGKLCIGMVEDVTEQKLAEERISSQAALLDQANDAILVRSCDGTIEYWNQGAERLYGWSRTEAIGRNVSEVMYRDRAGFDAAQAELLTKEAWNGELSQVTRSGRELVVEARWTLIRDAQGNPQRVLGINTDITEKKQLEAQVFAAQRMESLGTLAGGIAHDFNNILAAILANISLAVEDVGPEHPAQLALTEINDASLRAAALVRQILTFSRRRAPERRVMRAEGVVEEALKLLRATLPASVSIETDFASDAPEVFADATQVHQVVMNLGTNAAHAMRERGGVLRVACTHVSLSEELPIALGRLRRGRYARLSVEDSGAGMSDDTLQRIFDPFFTTKGPGEGTGLGLSVVLGVMRAHEGGVVVTSALGHGSRFDLYFPVARGASERSESRSVPPPKGRGERVLCIDDEASIARATVLLLERLGYEAVAHTHPSNALEAIGDRSSRFDAVVSDCSMPMISGHRFREGDLAPAARYARRSDFGFAGAQARAVTARARRT